MPNHVLTEVVFRDVASLKQVDILQKVMGRERAIDFETLLPMPLNIWRGNVGMEHKKAFPDNSLDWCTKNWGTKWNAYGIDKGGRYQSIERADDSLTLRFQTAWGPPMGWLVALFNHFRLSFDYAYLDEGDIRAKAGSFRLATDDFYGDQWKEREADDETHSRMHLLMYGRAEAA